MLGRSCDYHFKGWDEPPMPRRDRPHSYEGSLLRPAKRADENAPSRVMLEIGLVLAVPLALAAVITLVFRALGYPTGF